MTRLEDFLKQNKKDKFGLFQRPKCNASTYLMSERYSALIIMI